MVAVKALYCFRSIYNFSNLNNTAVKSSVFMWPGDPRAIRYFLGSSIPLSPPAFISAVALIESRFRTLGRTATRGEKKRLNYNWEII